MTAAAISRYLPEFEVADQRSGWGRSDAAPQSRTAARDAAFQEGLAKGKAAAEAELAQKLAEQKAAHERELASARQAWAGQEADKLAAQLAAGLAGIEARLAETAAHLLEPFLAAQLRRRAVADLADALNVLLVRDPAVAVSVSGAPDLIDALRARLAGKLDHVTFQPGASSELRVAAGQTLIETRLAAWMAAVEEQAA